MSLAVRPSLLGRHLLQGPWGYPDGQGTVSLLASPFAQQSLRLTTTDSIHNYGQLGNVGAQCDTALPLLTVIPCSFGQIA
jgi:hypothetical protein